MGHRATGSFDIIRWDSSTYDQAEGAELAGIEVGKNWHGDLEGTSTARLLTAVAQVPTSAAYVGIERVTARLAGRAGTFVLQHSARMTAEVGAGAPDVSVVPDTGTGELRGLRGDIEITRHEGGGHTYVFEYDLG